MAEISTHSPVKVEYLFACAFTSQNLSPCREVTLLGSGRVVHALVSKV